MTVVVFDTNTLFSAVGWRGNPYRCVELARLGTITGVTCYELLDELADKLQSKLNFPPELVADTIADFLGFLRLVSIPGKLKFIAADPDDDVVLECAVVGEADYIVSGDKRHLLPIGDYEGIRVVSSAEFLALMSNK